VADIANAAQRRVCRSCAPKRSCSQNSAQHVSCMQRSQSGFCLLEETEFHLDFHCSFAFIMFVLQYTLLLVMLRMCAGVAPCRFFDINLRLLLILNRFSRHHACCLGFTVAVNTVVPLLLSLLLHLQHLEPGALCARCVFSHHIDDG
jgi:hypothetical protein